MPSCSWRIASLPQLTTESYVLRTPPTRVIVHSMRDWFVLIAQQTYVLPVTCCWAMAPVISGPSSLSDLTMVER